MSEIKQDLLGLKYSPNFNIEGIEEADININLNPVNNTSATVYGTVTDGDNPVPDATVKLFDSNGVPFKHTLTNSIGQYSMDGVPVGTYTIGTVKNGYRFSNSVGLTLSENDTVEINFSCTKDVTLSLGAIAGIIKKIAGQSETPVVMEGAKVTLLNQSDEVISVTYTVDDGEFAFYDVADGIYTIIATADGFLSSAPTTVVITNGSIANLVITLVADTRTYNGTVSGIIRDNNGYIVTGCFVGLYKIIYESGVRKEILVSTTKTNGEGKYMFGQVDQGEYIVKAKKAKEPAVQA